jgi:pimeloyl-ACP methyl ester carboxylesterase
MSAAGAADVPEEFTRALADVPGHRGTAVEGALVRYRVWGPPGAPGVVLVHGGSAHAGWWDHIAPQLTGHRVVALDLSGHGDSEHRPAYDMSQWGREVLAVAAAEDLDRPVLVGHSRGGWVAVTAGAQHAPRVGGVVVVDSPLWTMTPDEEMLRRRRSPTRVYPSREAAVARFVTLPPQDVVLPWVRAHVAVQSVRPVDGGWTWKFDPQSFGRPIPQRDLLAALTVPATLVQCEHGLVSDAMAAEIAGLMPGAPPVVRLAGAGHHPMLDRPDGLVGTLRALLAAWTATRSAARSTA